MDTATIFNLDQPTIGPSDLRSFIEALDDARDSLCGPSADELSHITADLRVTLGKWHSAIERLTGTKSFDQIPDVDVDSTERQIDFDALQNIDAHLSRLILRHSNYGFAAANVTSELDQFFPQSELISVRKIALHLRRVISDLQAGRGANNDGSVTVTQPYSSIVSAW